MSEPANRGESGIEDLVIPPQQPEQPKPPAADAKVYVSYAWRDDPSPETAMLSIAVDALRKQVRNEGWAVVIDSPAQPVGETLSAFMRNLGPADLILVIVSPQYLDSIACMTELHLLWQQSTMFKAGFRRRVLPLLLADLGIGDWERHLEIAGRWQTKFDKMDAGWRFLGETDRARHLQIKKWHDSVGEILSHLAESLSPKAFADISKDDFQPLKELLATKRKELQTPDPQLALDQLVILGSIEMATPSFRMWAIPAGPVERSFSSGDGAPASGGSSSDRAIISQFVGAGDVAAPASGGSSSDRAELAIVFTDIVDSTALGQRLGDDRMEVVRRAHFAKSKEFIRQFQGREVKTIGDSFMVAFHSADSALAYARELQQNPGDPLLQVRAGIHVGKMTVDGEDVFGSAVNFAARVVSATKRPEIWVSDPARKRLRKPYQTLSWHPHEGVELKGFEPDKFTLWSLPPGS